MMVAPETLIIAVIAAFAIGWIGRGFSVRYEQYYVFGQLVKQWSDKDNVDKTDSD